jgi:putative protease
VSLLPELLSPAGSEECLYAAVENGADAVYFGLAPPHNFNARGRAENFPLEKLGDTLDFLHRRGIKGYLTLNTLIHFDELPAVESLLREIAAARVDAVIIQDIGVARLAQRLCPDLPLHASTQMSLTSAAAIELAATLGIRRAILPRELSIKQIGELCRHVELELECFIHGALCISYSGQCYASLGLGGRSANRGNCAQPCRLPYSIKQTGTERKPILSPHDLAALPLLPKLIATGIHAFKIEGRLKPPEYVAEVTKIYREALDYFAPLLP